MDDPINAPIRPTVADEAELRVFLEYEYEGLKQEIGECRAALQSLVDKYPDGFPDDEASGIAAENLRITSAKLAASDERRLEENKPYRSGQLIINTWFSNYIDAAVSDVRKTVQVMQNRYTQAKLRKAREAAEAAKLKAEAEAKRLAEEAAAAAQAGREDAFGKMREAGLAAEQANKAAERAEKVVVRTRGPMGAVSSSTVTWGWEVVDFTEIPDFFKCLDEAKVREAGRKRGPGGKPVATIPGLRWVERISERHR